MFVLLCLASGDEVLAQSDVAHEKLLEIIMRRYERVSTMITSNRPVDDWGKLLGDSAAVTAMLDRLLHHSHVLKCGPTQLAHKNRLASAVGGRIEQTMSWTASKVWPVLP